MTADIETAKLSYDKWHEQYPVDSGCDTPWHRWTQARLDPAAHLNGRIVLEIGCGRGGFARWLARVSEPRLLVAADFSESAVRMGRGLPDTHRRSTINWETADI